MSTPLRPGWSRTTPASGRSARTTRCASPSLPPSRARRWRPPTTSSAPCSSWRRRPATGSTGRRSVWTAVGSCGCDPAAGPGPPRRPPVMEARPVLDGLDMPECPRWRDGTLWLTDIWGHRVLQVVDGSALVALEFPDDEDPAGLGWLPDGRLLVVGMLRRMVYVADGGEVAVHADLSSMTPYPLNDMIVSDDGTAYVSGFGWDIWGGGTYADNALIRVGPDGRADAVADAMMAPNGMALTDDGRTLVVA